MFFFHFIFHTTQAGPFAWKAPLHLAQENYLITQSLSHLIRQMRVKVL